MLIKTKRLLDGLQEAISELAAIADPAGSTSHVLAANTIMGELLRREDLGLIHSNYVRGRDLGLRLAGVISKNGAVQCAGERALLALPDDICVLHDFGDAEQSIAQLRHALTSLILESGYPSDNTEVGGMVMGLLAWEADLFRLPPAPSPPKSAGSDMKAALAESMRAQGGRYTNAAIVKYSPLLGGFANDTFLFDVRDNGNTIESFVARAMQDVPLGIPGRDIGGEYHLLRYLHKHGVCVAEPMWLENERQTYGRRFFVSRKVPGRNVGSVIGADPLSAVQIKSLATELAKIHSLPIDANDPDVKRSHIDSGLASLPITNSINAYLDRWVSLWRSIDLGAYPIVETTLTWLQANEPQSGDAPVLVHGDYGPHNILFDDEAIGGVLDWEMSHMGDRAEDISLILSIGDVGADEFMKYYLEAGGRPVTNFQLKYYEVRAYFCLIVVALESQFRFNDILEAGARFCVLGANYIQKPTAELVKAIRAAEEAR